MNDLIKSSIEKEDEPETTSPVNPQLQLKPQFEIMLHQIQKIKDVQLNGINLFLFTGIQNHEDYLEATVLAKSIRSECERIHNIQEGAQVPDLVQLMVLLNATIDAYVGDEDDDDDDDEDLGVDNDEDFDEDDE